jgi:hypothetical protein
MKRTAPPQPDAWDALRSTVIGMGSAPSGLGEPSWESWITPLRLPSETARSLASSLRQLWLLPFADKAALADLLIFRHTRLAQIRGPAEAGGNLQCQRLCSLFGLLVDMALQGNSVFPQNPTHIAQQVQQALETPIPTEPIFEVLLGLLISANGRSCLSGFNFAQVADLEEVIQYEHGRRTGSPEWCWKAKHKYDLFATEVKRAPEFREDWALVCRHFKVDRYRDPKGIIRRSPLVEGNWQKPSYSDLRHEDNRFQVAFDFFCWKWFLYGMQGDDPMVQKLAVTLTPSGTQIFIPGFWSLDPARDINWAKVTRLHRARGISKQGGKMIENQKAHVELVKRVAIADQTARQQKLKGRRRYQYIKESAGLADNMDDAEIRRYLREAKGEVRP